ncbi:restriction endonuclease subunit S [Shewanella oncorhynchi]|uniref:restriction endonuclease subunit S n=1 Tax=Shewanella oncorhynchi TaxID=2726434 RepID=UPI003D7AA033
MADLSITNAHAHNIEATPKAENLITTHLDIWTTAIEQKSSAGRGSSKKFSLYGIKKLRELILELAVRGKLVPQDPNDEPASVLLERIAAEKARLVKEGILKKQKPLPEISDDEKPFELPHRWRWSRLSDCSYIFSGTAFKSSDFSTEHGVKTIKITNAGVGEIIETDESLPIHFLDEYRDFKVIEKDIILALTRPYISDGLKVSLCPASYNNSLLNQRVAAIRAFSYPEYLFLVLRSPYILNIYKNRFSGSGLQPNLKMSDVTDLVLGIPPLEEQHRIVAKVDELMSLCDALEAQTEASISAHQTLVETLLNALLLPQTAANTASQSDISLERPFTNSFVKDWQRVAEHFDTLFTTSASIDTLKQTILQLAVMGKLVKQDPNDEPAAILLARIAKEKAQLFKEGKIKKQKPLPAITDEEKQFELPSGWAYERIGTFGIVGTGSTPSRSNPLYWEPAEINWVSSGETSNFFVTQTKERVSELAIKETNVSIYPAGTLIVAMYGQGKTRGQITELLEPAGTNQACAAIRLVDESVNHKDYVKLFFRKAYLELREHAAGGAQPNLNVGKIASTIVPLPPLEEQHRIVAKVEELMALCDQLKVRLADAQTTQLHLTDAIVEQAL